LSSGKRKALTPGREKVLSFFLNEYRGGRERGGKYNSLRKHKNGRKRGLTLSSCRKRSGSRCGVFISLIFRAEQRRGGKRKKGVDIPIGTGGSGAFDVI